MTPRKRNKSAGGAIGPTPSELGYRMPAEWEPHAATWLAWPHYHGDWPGKFEPIPWVYGEIIRNLAEHERVELIVNDAATERRARKTLERADALSDNIRFHRWTTNRVWLRDSGCIFLTEQPGFARPDSRGRLSPHESLALKFRFNAWAKYSNWRFDDKTVKVRQKKRDKDKTFSYRDVPIHPALAGKKVWGLIWTTTPWTIPANMGIAFHDSQPATPK